MSLKIEQRDQLGNWGDDFLWNQGGNEFETEDEAQSAIDFIRTQYDDVPVGDLRIVEIDEEGLRVGGKENQ